MSRPTLPSVPSCTPSEPPLARLREPDASGLVLWSAVMVAGSVLLAFLATEPAVVGMDADVAAAAPAQRDPQASATTGDGRAAWTVGDASAPLGSH